MVIVALSLITVPAQMARPGKAASPVVVNSWRGIRPLRSSASDVARAVGAEAEQQDVSQSGPYKVEDGEVTFTYLTPSLAKIYRAPRSMVGKVFTIYFKPDRAVSRAEVKLAPGFKRCTEQQSKRYYYLVSDAGLAYQFRREDDLVEMIVYQPSRSEVQRLAVNTECVF
jgi:hypothetical protein